jgi:hypothetical protein
MRAVEGAFSLVDSSMTTGVIVNLVLAVVIRAPMKLMWNMLNTLQLLTFIPLLSLTLPTNLSVCLNMIQQVSCLSILPQSVTNYILEKIKMIPDPGNTLPTDGGANYTKNLGQMLAAVVIGLAGVALMYAFYKLAQRFPV